MRFLRILVAKTVFRTL